MALFSRKIRVEATIHLLIANTTTTNRKKITPCRICICLIFINKNIYLPYRILAGVNYMWICFCFQGTVQEARRHQIHYQRFPLLQPGFGDQRGGCRGYRECVDQGLRD